MAHNEVYDEETFDKGRSDRLMSSEIAQSIKKHIIFRVSESVDNFTLKNIVSFDDFVKNKNVLHKYPYTSFALIFDDFILVYEYIETGENKRIRINEYSCTPAIYYKIVKEDFRIRYTFTLTKDNIITDCLAEALHKGKCIYKEPIHILSSTPVQYESIRLFDKESFLLSLEILKRFLTMLQCTNIRSVDETATKIRIDRQSKKKKIKELYKYKMLQLKTRKRGSKNEPQDLWSNRVHMCRGHEKNYTDEAPLFGTIVGTYWWAPHVRGNKDKGIVEKEYVIDPSDITEPEVPLTD